MKNVLSPLILIVSSLLFFSCEKDNAFITSVASETSAGPVATAAAAGGKVVVIKAAGNIKDDVQAFKNMLGPLNTTPNATGGHREINWDGVPGNLLNKPLPNNLFNPTGPNADASMQRGMTYANGSFMVSNNGFAAINSQASSQFSAFSGTQTFANTTAARWDVAFQKAGTTQSASVQAFGLVFADVDKDNSTSVELFEGDSSLGKYLVPAHNSTSNFSFLGVNFKNNHHITKVTVSHNGFLSGGSNDISNGGTKDLVVLDDFIYSEPVANKFQTE